MVRLLGKLGMGESQVLSGKIKAVSLFAMVKQLILIVTNYFVKFKMFSITNAPTH
jgi:hypothetical protein